MKEIAKAMMDAAAEINKLRTENKELQSRLESLEKDSARIDWMQENYLCADFKYGDPATEVVVIEFPKKSRYRGDLRIDVDAAMQSANKGE